MKQFLGILRHALTALGSGLVANNSITAGDLEAIIGAVITLASIGWQVYDRMQERKRLATAIAAPAAPPAE